jgi:DNA-binding transcriptional MocR family regulator
MTTWTHHYATRMARLQTSEIRELLKLLHRPDIISFAGGIPDPQLFPATTIGAACEKIFSDPQLTVNALQYAISEGYLPLREWIAAYMGRMGVPCTTDNIMITNGSQQGLDYVGKMLISPGDMILVENPTFLGALQAFNAYEPTYGTLPAVGGAPADTAYTRKPKFGYVIPEFQNPSGNTLTQAERVALMDAIEKLDIPLVEDRPYEMLRYDGEAPPALLALAAERAGGIDQCKVLYCGTISKSLVPGLRIGWIAGAKEAIGKLVLINQASDLHVSQLTQMLALEAAKNHFEAQAAKAKPIYKARRDAMLKALDAYMPKTVTWTKPEGGFFVWMTLPEHIDGAKLLARAIEEAKVAFVPGEAFFATRAHKNNIRLSFSVTPPEQIEEGIKRLGELLKKNDL